jgi:hypothetical protein
MESRPNFYDYGHFSDQSPSQKSSVYNGSSGGGVFEGWNFEEFRYEPGLDVDNFQPALGFESENGIAQSNSTTDFDCSQSRFCTALGNTGDNHFNSIWVPQEAPEAYNWLPNSDANAACADFPQEIRSGIRITKSPTATAYVPLYDVGPPQTISPSSIPIQSLCNGKVKIKPPVYPPQQGFELLPGGERGENQLFNNSLYVS